MPKKNTIVIEYHPASGLKATMYPDPPVAKDITPIFRQITGATGVGSRWSQLTLSRKVTNGSEVQTEVAFQPTDKELVFTVSPEVIRHILSLL